MAVAELRPHYVYVACATIMLHIPPYIYIYIYHTSSNLYTPDSVSLARQLSIVDICICYSSPVYKFIWHARPNLCDCFIGACDL